MRRLAPVLTASTPSYQVRARAITRTALDIVDAGGLPALTMRRLASEAGVTPMALYWYFDDKDAVLDAVIRLIDEEMAEQKPEDVGQAASGPQWLSELMSRAVRVLTSHHPDLTTLVQSRVSSRNSQHLTNQALDNFERSLGHLAELGITGVEAVQLSFLISQGVFMLALACRRDPGEEGSPDARMRAQWESLRVVSAEDYPHIRGAAEAFVRNEDPKSLLERGIELFESVLRRHSACRPE